MMEGMIGKKKMINPAQAQARKDKEKEKKRNKKENKKAKEEFSVMNNSSKLQGEIEKIAEAEKSGDADVEMKRKKLAFIQQKEMLEVKRKHAEDKEKREKMLEEMRWAQVRNRQNNNSTTTTSAISPATTNIHKERDEEEKESKWDRIDTSKVPVYDPSSSLPPPPPIPPVYHPSSSLPPPPPLPSSFSSSNPSMLSRPPPSSLPVYQQQLQLQQQQQQQQQHHHPMFHTPPHGIPMFPGPPRGLPPPHAMLPGPPRGPPPSHALLSAPNPPVALKESEVKNEAKKEEEAPKKAKISANTLAFVPRSVLKKPEAVSHTIVPIPSSNPLKRKLETITTTTSSYPPAKTSSFSAPGPSTVRKLVVQSDVKYQQNDDFEEFMSQFN